MLMINTRISIVVIVFLLFLNLVNCLTNFLLNLNLIKNYVPKVDEMISSICYPEIEGCFNQNPIYDLRNRKLIFYTPQPPLKLNIKFYLLNKPDDDIEKSFSFYFNNLTDQLIGQVQLSNTQHTLVLIPGWLEEYTETRNWVQSIDNWSNKDNYQLIILDSECFLKCTYEEAVTSSIVISKVLSVILLQLNSKGKIDLAKTHLIGKNLGAHIAGQTGHHLGNKRAKASKITAFNPPLDLFEERTDADKVDSNDANHVEVIHTNVNRREFIQAGIGLVDVFVYDSFKPNPLILSQQYANRFKLSSNSEIDLKMRMALKNSSQFKVDKNCHLLAFRCDSYQNFLDGKCANCENERDCKLIGLWSNQLNTKFESSSKPFHYYSIQDTDRTSCVYHYLIQVTIGSIFRNKKSKGIIEISLQNDTVYIQSDEFGRNQTFTKLYTSIGPITNLKQIKVGWSNLVSGIWVFTYNNAIHVEKIKLNYLSNLDDRIRQAHSNLYCLSNLGTNVIAHKQFIYLKKCQ